MTYTIQNKIRQINFLKEALSRYDPGSPQYLHAQRLFADLCNKIRFYQRLEEWKINPGLLKEEKEQPRPWSLKRPSLKLLNLFIP